MPTRRLHAILISSHSSRQTEGRKKTGAARERERLRVGHHRDDLYFMDLSISVSVHGWEVREQSLSAWPTCLLTLSLYHGTPYLFTPPPRSPMHNGMSDFSSPRGFSNPNVWGNIISHTICDDGVIVNVRRRTGNNVVGCLIQHRWYCRLRYVENNSTRLVLLCDFSSCFKLNRTKVMCKCISQGMKSCIFLVICINMPHLNL